MCDYNENIFCTKSNRSLDLHLTSLVVIYLTALVSTFKNKKYFKMEMKTQTLGCESHI